MYIATVATVIIGSHTYFSPVPPIAPPEVRKQYMVSVLKQNFLSSWKSTHTHTHTPAVVAAGTAQVLPLRRQSEEGYGSTMPHSSSTAAREE